MGYRQKMDSEWRPLSDNSAADGDSTTSPDYWVFHAPYNKLVRKTFGRVVYHDFLNNPEIYYWKYADNAKTMEFLKKYEKIPCSETINNREVIKGFEKLSAPFYDRYVSPSTVIPRSIGNCYTASIFMGLVSLIQQCAGTDVSTVMGKNIQMFSYGSGTVASLYSLRVLNTAGAKEMLNRIVVNNDIESRFEERIKMPCHEFEKITDAKQQQFHDDQKSGDHVPQGIVAVDYFYPNTYYLVRMDGKRQRFYAQFEHKEKSLDLDSIGTSSCSELDSMANFSSAEDKEQELTVEKQGNYGSFTMMTQLMDKLSMNVCASSEAANTNNEPVAL